MVVSAPHVTWIIHSNTTTIHNHSTTIHPHGHGGHGVLAAAVVSVLVNLNLKTLANPIKTRQTLNALKPTSMERTTCLMHQYVFFKGFHISFSRSVFF
jgi:hypothetical protein